MKRWAVAAVITLCLLLCNRTAPGSTIAPLTHPSGNQTALNTSASPLSFYNPSSNDEFEIVGFTIKGNKPWERNSIPDLPVVRRAGALRFLPLVRLLKILDLQQTESQGIIQFTPDGAPTVNLDLNRQVAIISGVTKNIEIVTDSAESAGIENIYLASDLVATLFDFDLQWREQDYEFVARTNRQLGIWKSSGGSLLSINAQEIPSNLPEVLPPAVPRSTSLDFMELQLGLRAVREQNGASFNGGADTLRQTLWGRLFNGAFRLQFSEPQLLIGNSIGASRENAVFMLDRGEWFYRLPTVEMAIGDSAFGLNDLTVPFVRIAGVRFNGVTGPGTMATTGERSRLGMRPYFLRPQIFEGVAVRGAKVALMINGRTVDTQEAIANNYTPPGVGSYRFEDIILAPGSLNEVVIVITDPNGAISHIQEFVQGTSQLLAAGQFAYLGGIGTGREVQTWATRGLFGGVRGLYGITDQLTVGGSIGYQEGLYRPVTINSFDSDQRQPPPSSIHAGSQFTWQPNVHGLLGGDVSFSYAKGRFKESTYVDAAYKTYATVFPCRGVMLSSQFFSYGSDFFDGQNTRLHDRRGYSVNGLWGTRQAFTVAGAFGNVWNNLDGAGAETFTVGFQNLEITTRPFPTTVVTAGMTRLSASSEEPRVLYALKLRATPIPDLTFEGTIVTGNSLVLSEKPEFFSGLKIPGLATFTEPSTTALLRKVVDRNNNLTASYWKSGNQERSSLSHTFRGLQQHSLGIRTELGYDMTNHGPFLENRGEYLFNGVSRRSIELLTRYERKEWTVGLFLNLAELINFERGTPSILTTRNIHPDSGGIKGRVFLDYNGNASPDPDEPGLESIQVLLGSFSCQTDQNGVFVLQGPGNYGKVRIALDLKSVPANYTPTHGTQMAHISPGSLTEVNLGVIPVISVSGELIADLPDRKNKPVIGVKVYLVDLKSGKILGDSVTASDGSYYLGDVRPGKYLVRIDTSTLPKQCTLVETERSIEILPEREPQELKLAPFNALLTPESREKAL